MEELILKFSFKLFALHFIAYTMILLGFLSIFGYSTVNILICLGVFVLFFVVSASRSKTFIVKNNLIVINYVFLGYKKEIELGDVAQVFFHRKKIDREWHFLEVKRRNGRVNTFSFYYTNSSSRELFFDKLKSIYGAIEI